MVCWRQEKRLNFFIPGTWQRINRETADSVTVLCIKDRFARAMSYRPLFLASKTVRLITTCCVLWAMSISPTEIVFRSSNIKRFLCEGWDGFIGAHKSPRALTLSGVPGLGWIMWAGPAAGSTQLKDPAQLSAHPWPKEGLQLRVGLDVLGPLAPNPGGNTSRQVSRWVLEGLSAAFSLLFTLFISWPVSGPQSLGSVSPTLEKLWQLGRPFEIQKTQVLMPTLPLNNQVSLNIPLP